MAEFRPFNYGEAVNQGQTNALNAEKLREGVRKAQGRNMLANLAAQNVTGSEAINYLNQQGRPDVAQVYQKQQAEKDKIKYEYMKRNEWGVNDQASWNAFNDKALADGILTPEEREEERRTPWEEGRKNLDRMMGREAATSYEAIRDDEGGIVAQRNINTNKVESDPRAPSDPDTVVNNIMGDQDELAKSLSKQVGEEMVVKWKGANDAVKSLESTNAAVDLLNSGIISGTGANAIKEVGKALRRIGIDYFEDDIANTEAYAANQARQVAEIIKAFGSGTGLSDADREYAEKAAAGKVTMNEKALRKILSLNQKASRNVIEAFNKDWKKIPVSSQPFDMSVDIPDYKSPTGELPTPQTQEDFDALSSGDEYIDPDDGRTYRKP